jgi:hypothetical protein
MTLPVAMHFGRNSGVGIEREETRDTFDSDPLTVEVVGELLLASCLPQIRRNYRVTKFEQRADGNFVATFTRR